MYFFRIGAHDGYYGLAVMNIFYMLSNLVVPSLMNYFRCKVRSLRLSLIKDTNDMIRKIVLFTSWECAD